MHCVSRSFLFLCVHMCLQVCVLVCRGQRSVLGVYLPCSTLQFEIGLFIETGTYWLASLASEPQVSVDVWLSNSEMAGAVPWHPAFKNYFYLCVWVYFACMYAWGPFASSAYRGQKRHQKPWNLSWRSLWAAMWVMGTEAGSFGRIASAPNPHGHLSCLIMLTF